MEAWKLLLDEPTVQHNSLKRDPYRGDVLQGGLLWGLTDPSFPSSTVPSLLSTVVLLAAFQR